MSRGTSVSGMRASIRAAARISTSRPLVGVAWPKKAKRPDLASSSASVSGGYSAWWSRPFSITAMRPGAMPQSSKRSRRNSLGDNRWSNRSSISIMRALRSTKSTGGRPRQAAQATSAEAWHSSPERLTIWP